MIRPLLCVLSIVALAASQRPEVITPLGKIQGYLKTSFKGAPYSAFEGIPYAKKPIGDLRFARPQPVEPWTGTWNATTLHECVQTDLTHKVLGSEDCLYVNVYVPREQPLFIEEIDVIAHIHGGGFKMGSPFSYTLPDYLMDQHVIFVTFTYRLEALGFLSTGDDLVPGNMGLWDQVLALQWIQDNIKSFGGEPKYVTVTGFSAGAASSHLLYLSPKVNDLFSKGVSHSGTAVSFWSITENPLQAAQDLGESLGCPIETNTELLQCLRERSVEDILYKTMEIQPNPWTLRFRPVVDGDLLPKSPIKILEEDQLKDIPWMFSTTAEDGLFPGVLYASFLEELNKNWSQIAPPMLTLTPEKADLIKKAYVSEDGQLGYRDFVKLLTDRYFIADAEKSAMLQSKRSKGSVYFYYYNFFGGTTFTDLFESNMDSSLKGIGHGDDIIHLYGNVIPNAVLNDDDKEMIEVMLTLLRSFVRRGKPVLKDIDWQPTGDKELTYLNISGPSQLTVETRPSITKASLWKILETETGRDEL